MCGPLNRYARIPTFMVAGLALEIKRHLAKAREDKRSRIYILNNTYCLISDLPRNHHQTVTACGLIIVSRSHLQQNGEPMKFISICDRSGIVECEIFADAYRAYGLATVRYPIVQVTAEVTHFDNQAGFTLAVQRIEKARHVQMTKPSS